MMSSANRKDNHRGDQCGELFVKIDCYLSLDCGSEQALREKITRALAIEKIEADVTFTRIADEEAIALGISGSPSVFICGKELQLQ
jgi:hypothetical protein